jgi:hypothetical protein
LTLSPSDVRLSDPPTVTKISEAKMSFASVGGDGKVRFEKEQQ